MLCLEVPSNKIRHRDTDRIVCFYDKGYTKLVGYIILECDQEDNNKIIVRFEGFDKFKMEKLEKHFGEQENEKVFYLWGANSVNHDQRTICIYDCDKAKLAGKIIFYPGSRSRLLFDKFEGMQIVRYSLLLKPNYKGTKYKGNELIKAYLKENL